MRSSLFLLLWLALVPTAAIIGQPAPFNKVKFFEEETPLKASLEADWSKLINQKKSSDKIYQGIFSCTLPEQGAVSETVNLQVKGHFRREHCYVPPIKISFKKSPQSVMHSLKGLKMVNACKANPVNDQYLLREYLIYKMYNLLTDKSFRVRLLEIDFKDSSGRISPFTSHSFLIEDVDDMAKRNQCVEWKGVNLHPERTDRKQMTLLAIFEYMIGNTDWSVAVNHNIRLIQLKENPSSMPYAVLYDLDWSGIVNTDYAVPDPLLNTESVKERVYRGFPRTLEEINEALEIFKSRKDQIYALINGFEPLDAKSKKSMTSYLDDFYKLINSPKSVKSVFVDEARTE